MWYASLIKPWERAGKNHRPQRLTTQLPLPSFLKPCSIPISPGTPNMSIELQNIETHSLQFRCHRIGKVSICWKIASIVTTIISPKVFLFQLDMHFIKNHKHPCAVFLIYDNHREENVETQRIQFDITIKIRSSKDCIMTFLGANYFFTIPVTWLEKLKDQSESAWHAQMSQCY